MTRLLTCGYETGDVNEAGSSFIAPNATLTVVNTAPVPRAGTYCLKAATTTTSNNVSYKTFTLSAAKTELWVRFAIYVNPLTATTVAIFAAMNDSTGGLQCCLSLDPTTSALQARTGTSVIIASGGSMTPNAWHIIEWRVQITSTSSGITEVWLDGTRVINFSGDNTNGTAANVQQVLLGMPYAAFTTTGTYVAIDDIAINDTSGTLNNGRPGDGRVVLLVPTGAGSTTNLTRGGTDTGANWSQTSELPPSMNQYVVSSTPGTRDTYALSDLPTLPIPIVAINAVEVVVLGQNSDAGAGSLGLTVKSGATTNEGTAQALGTAAQYVRQLYETDPNTGAAWTTTAVNALEAGVTVR